MMQVMDAGIRDNLGLINTIRYLNAMSEWLDKNTSGVVIIQVRDTYNVVNVQEDPQSGFIKSIVSPFSDLYRNYLAIQRFDQEEIMVQSSPGFKNKISGINFQLNRTMEENISLSWHLTEKEKQQVIESFDSPENQLAVETLKLLLR
jgi:hypothetical protein